MRIQSIVIAGFVVCMVLPTAVVHAGHHGHRAGNIYGIYAMPSIMYPNAVGGYDTTYHGPRQFYVLPAKSGCLFGHLAAGKSGHYAQHGSGYCGTGPDAYGSGCGSAGCGSYGNANGAGGYSTGSQSSGPGSEGVIYDGPAAGSTTYEGPTSGNAATTYPDEARSGSPTRFQLVSNATQDGSVAFQKGLTMFRSRQLTEALGSFETAAETEPNNAMYQYYVALAMHDLHGAEAAGDSLQKAVELEQREPIASWGKKMERVQGRARSWVETARRKVGLAR